jgi:GT2 family glycosyltransferase/glycosyltransferase involved in cell wall biosynthesis
MGLTPSAPDVSVILHAYAWPDAATLDAIRGRVAEALRDAAIEIIEAREDPAAVIGAAALINRAAASTRGRVLLVLEPCVLLPADPLRALITAAAAGGLAIEREIDAARNAASAIAAAGAATDARADDATTDSSHAQASESESKSETSTAAATATAAAAAAAAADDVLGQIDALLQRERAGALADAALPPSARQAVWTIARTAFDVLGGLDARCWSVGVVDDLRARAALAGVAVCDVDLHAESTGGVAYPLRADVARWLRLRNPLLTAFKTLPADRLGERLAQAAALAFARAWDATGLSDTTFQFGGSWGRRDAAWQRLARRAVGGSQLPVALRDPDGCLAPLLAIDSALDEFVTLDRPRALSHPHAPHAALSSSPSSDAAADAATNRDRADMQAHAPAPEAATQSPSATDADRLPEHAVTSAQAGARRDDAGADLPRLSVLVVNWNGQEHLRDCFGSLSRSDYPADRVELICVDNGSVDGSRDLLRAEFPHVTLVALDSNRGFTGGNAAGVAAASGDVFVFLNNDMRVEPDCLRELVRGLGAASACVGARVLSWDGRSIDFIRGSLNFEAHGFQDFYGEPNAPEFSTPADTFFPNGGAFAVTREAYARAGGFDPAFFAYYDDTDLGWRLRVTGAGIHVAGRAVVYHRHGATVRTQPKGQKRFLMERNALWTLMKNYGDDALRRTLGIALALAARRLLDATNIDRRAPLCHTLAPFAQRCRRRGETTWTAEAVYEPIGNRVAIPRAPSEEMTPVLGRGDGERERHRAAHMAAPQAPAQRATGSGVGADTTRTALRAMPVETLGATAAALAGLPRIMRARAAVQAARRVPDAEILPRFGRSLEAVSSVSSYKRLQHVLTEAHGLPDLFRTRTRLLIIGHEAIAANMSGPAVRVLEMGRALAAVARVTIATPMPAAIDEPLVTFATFSPADAGGGLRRLAEDADVLLVQGFTLVQYPFLKTMHVPVIVDLYCPFTLEHLEQTRSRIAATSSTPPSQEALIATQHAAASVLGVQNDQLRDGDFFLCASEAQRDFWIGALHSHGRLNPLTYDDDPTLRRLIDVVPFGLPEEEAPAHAARAQAARGEPGRPVMKGVRPGIGPDDRVLLWAGSMLDWQDPLTLIRAVGDLARTRPEIKLLFMGTKHPNPAVSPMQVVEDSRALAQQLGLLDTHVFFNDWVPYDQRARYLVEADLGVSTHLDHLETHFSFRTRMLDYIWAGLPIVCTRGDFFAGLVDTRGLGATVPPGDVAALSHAVADLLDDPDNLSVTRSRLEQLRHELRWSTVIAPLARYCSQPYFAADRAPAMRAFRSRLEQHYRSSKWLKRMVLRFGVSEYQIERLKQSGVGRAAMSAQARLALHRARRSG